MKIDDSERMTATQIAELFGVTAQAVGMWVKRTGCPRNGDGTYSLGDVIRWREEQAEEQASRAKLSPSRELKEQADAEWIKIKIEQKRGELISRAEVVQEFVARVREIKRGLFGIPKRLCHRLAAMGNPHEIETLLSKAFTDLCNQYAAPLRSAARADKNPLPGRPRNGKSR